MTTPDHPASRHAWTRYWQTGALHACATSYRGNYGGAVAAYWSSAFEALAPGDRVLDAAAGNGALAQLLVAHCADRSVTCDAVDRAELAPAWVAPEDPAWPARVRFHAATPLEALPFADATFSLAVSQYGLEYSDLERSLPEVLRVTRKPGRVALLVHHAGSRPVALAREEVSHLEWLLKPGGFVALSRSMLEPLTLAQTPEGRAALARSPEADRLRMGFNAVQQALSARIAGSSCPDVLHEVREAVGRMFQTLPSVGTRAAALRLDALRAALGDNALRLADLLSCAMDETRVRSLGARLSGNSRIGTLHEGDALMGWTVQADVD